MAEPAPATNAGWFARAAAPSPVGSTRRCAPSPSVGGTPYTVVSGEGPYVVDAEGRRYIDLVQSYGAVLLGHAHPVVTEAVAATAARGTTFGAPTPGEVLLAEAICERVPGVRAGPPRLVGHRGRHERGAPRPRRHRPGPGRQVRRVLPRALRRSARRRRQRCGHARAARVGRRAGRRRRRHRGGALQRGPGAGRACGLRHRRAGRREHEPGPAGTGLSGATCAPRAMPPVRS